MPTLRLIYLTEQQYADMTEDKTNNTTTAASEFPTTIKHIHDKHSRFPIDDATRNASSNNKEPQAVGGETYAPVVEAELRKTSPLDSSGVVISNTALTASRLALDHSSATAETIMNVSNEDTNTGASPTRGVSAIAAATLVDKRRKFQKTFDERFKDLMAFKAKFGHCNVPCTKSSNNKHLSLGIWCSNVRMSYKSIKEGTTTRNIKLSKADMKRLENAGFEWNCCKKFDDRFKDLMAFKAKFGHCNVSRTNSSNNKYRSLGQWCSHVRQTYKAIKEGGRLRCKLSKADMKRLEKAGFEWRLK